MFAKLLKEVFKIITFSAILCILVIQMAIAKEKPIVRHNFKAQVVSP
ncbi:MAG: hypothetical protein ETSY2_21650 [Candidatus Entotheonella gemina]|uniref:Uncharacterized protein n=1 Tax=Candidatus Entotheonella gemina TaxID=1429439 RepID=W4M624_9BACT|nr:MAG: hypothetical protein ETSY2_21650 [Candidatus Entotheonella gemina]